MSEKKKAPQKEKEKVLSPQEKLDAAFRENIQSASKELTILLQRHGLELRVTHTIQLMPKRQ